ncbi:hypothetical protein BJ170DRAFT_718007 [Xylariales sp. AK1849]|nr:hypothetical protein BJ170DRAFT_718007 [Xylariales sp. AK1849]
MRNSSRKVVTPSSFYIIFFFLLEFLPFNMLAAQCLLFVAAALSSAVSAAPLGDDKPKRVAEISGYDCGGARFTLAKVPDGYGDATRAIQTDAVYVYHAPNGDRTYPGPFRNGGANEELDPSPCAGKQLLEFPILITGAAYTGGNPGAHRVIMADHGDGTSYDQCFLMMHRGAPGNLFNKCRPYYMKALRGRK